MPYPLRRPSYGVLLGAAVGLAAQEPAPGRQEPHEPGTFRTEATDIRVDVFPTRDGRPVSGLRAEDFERLEDGVRQEIRAFGFFLDVPHVPIEGGLSITQLPLDRNAQPLQVPLETIQRSDAHGRWLVVDASLSAPGAGDYVVEVGNVLNGTEHRVQTPVRVTR